MKPYLFDLRNGLVELAFPPVNSGGLIEAPCAPRRNPARNTCFRR